MSSCFLCDCSYKFTTNDVYTVYYSGSQGFSCCMKYMPIMVGSSGLEIGRQGGVVGCGTDQQHKDNNKQNYVSYRVKKIEFRASVFFQEQNFNPIVPDYIIIFKVPFRNPVFDYYFTVMKNFILFSEPESVLKYGVYPQKAHYVSGEYVYNKNAPDRYNLSVDKPFFVGPSDYVGVLYMFNSLVNVDASARVWFDVV